MTAFMHSTRQMPVHVHAPVYLHAQVQSDPQVRRPLQTDGIQISRHLNSRMDPPRSPTCHGIVVTMPQASLLCLRLSSDMYRNKLGRILPEVTFPALTVGRPASCEPSDQERKRSFRLNAQGLGAIMLESITLQCVCL